MQNADRRFLAEDILKGKILAEDIIGGKILTDDIIGGKNENVSQRP
jgi:hypothetical protein